MFISKSLLLIMPISLRSGERGRERDGPFMLYAPLVLLNNKMCAFQMSSYHSGGEGGGERGRQARDPEALTPRKAPGVGSHGTPCGSEV